MRCEIDVLSTFEMEMVLDSSRLMKYFYQSMHGFDTICNAHTIADHHHWSFSKQG